MLPIIKDLIDIIKRNREIPADEKEKAIALLADVARIVALY